MRVSRCGTLAVAFLPQVWRFPVDFLGKQPTAAEPLPRQAVWPPQIWIGG
jgi:hypothetical protein